MTVEQVELAYYCALELEMERGQMVAAALSPMILASGLMARLPR